MPQLDTLTTQSLDSLILEAYGITYKMYQPWQIGLFHPEIEGKFVWYPKKGTLMRDSIESRRKLGTYYDTEDVAIAITSFLPE